MMKKYKYLFILMIIVAPKICFAKNITGYESVWGASGTVTGEPTCTASVTVQDASKGEMLETGVCVGGGVRHGTLDYCCDSAHNAYNDCKKWVEASGCGYSCSKGNYDKTQCRKIGGSWRYSCLVDAHWDEGTKTEFVHNYVVVVTGKGRNKCGTGTITCKGSYSGVVSASFTTYAEWKSYSIKSRQVSALDGKNLVKYQDSKDNQQYAYGGKWIDGIFYADTAYYRGCGSPKSVSINPPDEEKVMGCWRQKKSNVSGLSLYGEEDYYEYKWSHVGYCGTKTCKQETLDDDGKPKTITYNCGSKRCNTTLGAGNWELYKIAGEDGMTEELCGRKKDAICQPTTPAELNEARDANYCSQKDLDVPLDEKTRCGVDENTFYTINCKESVKTNYEPVNFEKVLVNGNYIDEKIAVVQPGTGFRYNVRFNHVRSCEGNFNYKKFNDVFKNNIEIIKRADIFGDAYEYAWYYKILEAINAISQTYEDQYQNIVEYGKYLFNYDGTISFDYKWQEKAQSKQTAFVMNEDEEKVYLENNNPIFSESYSVQTGEPNFVNHKLVSGITNKTLHTFKYTLHQESLLEPKRIYIDSKTGKEAETGIDAGKKILTELKTDETKDGNYKIATQINVYKKSSPSKAIVTITNEKCELKVLGDKVSYRIIEPTNPFVNSSREIPKNWNGPIADFTKIINPSIGSTLIK